MMDYNTSEYIRFLKIIYKFRLYFCCCCCGYSLVVYQINELDTDQKQMVIEMDAAQDKSMVTANISINDQKIEQNGCELSIETTVRI